MSEELVPQKRVYTDEENREFIDKLVNSRLFKLAQLSLMKQKKYKKHLIHGVELGELDIIEIYIEGIRLSNLISKKHLEKEWNDYVGHKKKAKKDKTI